MFRKSRNFVTVLVFEAILSLAPFLYCAPVIFLYLSLSESMADLMERSFSIKTVNH